MSDSALLIVIFFAPLVMQIPLYIHTWRDFRRPTTAAFQKWRPWLRFSEPETGQQNHLPKNKELKTKSAVFWMEGMCLCRFRLRFGLASLGAVGQISWDGTEIWVEGRVSPLTVAGPLLTACWLGLFVVAAYLLGGTGYSVKTLVSIVGVMTVIIGVAGLALLGQMLLERRRFRQAYREIKTRIWSTG